jgi:hypothetical protein
VEKKYGIRENQFQYFSNPTNSENFGLLSKALSSKIESKIPEIAMIIKDWGA